LRTFLYFILALLITMPLRAADSSAAELDLGAMVQPAPMDAMITDPGYHVWCSAPTQTTDGKCHLYYSRWLTKDFFAPGWAIHSEICYAVADKPEGPFKFVNVALPARGPSFWDGTTTHNPDILQKDGKFYLFYMGNTGDGKYITHRNNQRVGVAIANNPEGPWTRFDKPIIDVSPDDNAFDSLCVTNPAAAVRPDGGILLIYKAVTKSPGKPEGPYVKTPGHIFEATNDGGNTWMFAEDPFIWYSLNWKPSEHSKVLGSGFKWANGKRSNSRIERPALLFNNDGVPTTLFGATDGYLNGHASFNVQIPLFVPSAN
jgi:hypothetical protein